MVSIYTTELLGRVERWEVRGKGLGWYWWERTRNDQLKGKEDHEARKGREFLTWKTGKGDQGSTVFLEDGQDIARRRAIWVTRVGCGLVQCSTGKVWLGILLWASTLRWCWSFFDEAILLFLLSFGPHHRGARTRSSIHCELNGLIQIFIMHLEKGECSRLWQEFHYHCYCYCCCFFPASKLMT